MVRSKWDRLDPQIQDDLSELWPGISPLSGKHTVPVRHRSAAGSWIGVVCFGGRNSWSEVPAVVASSFITGSRWLSLSQWRTQTKNKAGRETPMGSTKQGGTR